MKYSRKVHTKLNPNVEDTLLNLVLISYVWKEADTVLGKSDEPILPLKSQTLEDVIDTWPQGNIDVRIGDYMFRPHQKWTITAVPDAGGYLGGPYYKIVIEGTNRALAATADAEVTTVPEFTGAPEQLWKIEQLTDGTYRIMPKKFLGQMKN